MKDVLVPFGFIKSFYSNTKKIGSNTFKRLGAISLLTFGVLVNYQEPSIALDCPTSWNLQAPVLVATPPDGMTTQSFTGGGGAKMDGLGLIIFTKPVSDVSIENILNLKKQQLAGNLVSSISTQFSNDKINWRNSPLAYSAQGSFFFGAAYGSPFFSNYRLIQEGLSNIYMKVVYTISVNGCPTFNLETSPTLLPEVSSTPIGIDASIQSMINHGFIDFTQSDLVKTAILNLENQLSSTNFYKRTARPRDLNLPWSLPPHIGILDVNNCTNTYGNALSLKGNTCTVNLMIGDFWIVDKLTLHASPVKIKKSVPGAKHK